MTISCDDKAIQRLCSEPKRRLKELGAIGAKRFGQRLADLSAAGSLEELRHGPGRLHELTSNRAGELSYDLEHPYRLLFVPDHAPLPRLANGALDWKLVTAVRLTAIENTHGK